MRQPDDMDDCPQCRSCGKGPNNCTCAPADTKAPECARCGARHEREHCADDFLRDSPIPFPHPPASEPRDELDYDELCSALSKAEAARSALAGILAEKKANHCRAVERFSLAEQDRDSWKNSFLTQQEAANSLIEELQRKLIDETNRNADVRDTCQRLRTALELIASMGGRNDGCDYCAKNAREALE